MPCEKCAELDKQMQKIFTNLRKSNLKIDDFRVN